MPTRPLRVGDMVRIKREHRGNYASWCSQPQTKIVVTHIHGNVYCSVLMYRHIRTTGSEYSNSERFVRETRAARGTMGVPVDYHPRRHFELEEEVPDESGSIASSRG